jgi:hypothetical protein
MSVRGDGPSIASAPTAKDKDADGKKGKSGKEGSGKGRSSGGKEKRRESASGDAGRKKQRV